MTIEDAVAASWPLSSLLIGQHDHHPLSATTSGHLPPPAAPRSSSGGGRCWGQRQQKQQQEQHGRLAPADAAAAAAEEAAGVQPTMATSDEILHRACPNNNSSTAAASADAAAGTATHMDVDGGDTCHVTAAAAAVARSCGLTPLVTPGARGAGDGGDGAAPAPAPLRVWSDGGSAQAMHAAAGAAAGPLDDGAPLVFPPFDLNSSSLWQAGQPRSGRPPRPERGR